LRIADFGFKGKEQSAEKKLQIAAKGTDVWRAQQWLTRTEGLLDRVNWFIESSN